MSSNTRYVIESRGRLGLGNNWTVERTADHFTCTSFWARKENRGRFAVMIAVAVFLIVFVFPWFTGSESDPDGRSMVESEGSFAATLPFSLILAAAVSYLMLTMMFNRTELQISDGRLTVRYPPLPALPGVSLSTEEITQIFCLKIVRNRQASYALYAVLNNRVRRKLFHGVPADEPDVARQLETAIESFLGLADISVDEIPPEHGGFRFWLQRMFLGLIIVGLLGAILPVPILSDVLVIGRFPIVRFIGVLLILFSGAGWVVAYSFKDQILKDH